MISLAEYVLSPIIIKTSFNCGVLPNNAPNITEHDLYKSTIRMKL